MTSRIQERSTKQGLKARGIKSEASAITTIGKHPPSKQVDSENKQTTNSVSWEYAVAKFHICYQIAALGVLFISPNDYDVTILVLMVGYHSALYIKLLSNYSLVWDVYLFLVPLSIFMVLPDWILSQELGILEFIHDKVPMIGTVPVYMALMWVIPLLICTLTGEVLQQRGYSETAVTLAIVGTSLILFGGAEATMHTISWGARNVTLIHSEYLPMAYYILPAELCLGVNTFNAYRATRTAGHYARITAALNVMLLYIGTSVACYFLLERVDYAFGRVEN